MHNRERKVIQAEKTAIDLPDEVVHRAIVARVKEAVGDGKMQGAFTR
jgi:hypothetical protein